MADPDAPFIIDENIGQEGEAPPPAEGEIPLGEGEIPPVEGEAGEPPKPIEEEYVPYVPPPPKVIPPPKKIICAHWIRPTFLNYDFIYDYQHNYYDDVIDYMDRRLRGISRDIPRAQTWAERALRTYTCKELPGIYYHWPSKQEWQGTLKVAKTFRSQHTTNFFHRKYKSILY